MGFYSAHGKTNRFVVQSRERKIVESKVAYYKKQGCEVISKPEIRTEYTRYGDPYYIAVLKKKNKTHSA